MANIFYKLWFNVNQELGGKLEWFENIKNILNNWGISNVWVNQYVANRTLIDQFKQNWQATVQTSPKALNYRIYKNELFLEKYFNFF
jgi:hypothetical protein